MLATNLGEVIRLQADHGCFDHEYDLVMVEKEDAEGVFG
jgi:hypothetical protein